MNDEFDDVDADAEWGFEPAVSATGADPDRARRPRRRLRLRLPARSAASSAAARRAVRRARPAPAPPTRRSPTSSGAADVRPRTRRRAGPAAVRGQLHHLPRREPRRASRTAARPSSASAAPRPTSRSSPAACRSSARAPTRRASSRSSPRSRSARSPRTSRPWAAARSCPTASCSAATRVLGEGGELFRVNCASCHGTTVQGRAAVGGQAAHRR